jgi:ribosome-binding protein aMBF1 (putative translation factor)
MLEKLTVASLIDQWPSRKALADEIGANPAAVHKWATAKRIPADWQAHVLKAARLRGIQITPEWMIDVHARNQSRRTKSTALSSGDVS